MWQKAIKKTVICKLKSKVLQAWFLIAELMINGWRQLTQQADRIKKFKRLCALAYNR